MNGMPSTDRFRGAPQAAARLQASRLQVRAGDRLLVDALDWQAQAGESWCVIGRNGAGKSSLLRVLAGLAVPAGGSVAMDGRAMAAWPVAALARQRAWLPQARSDTFGYRVLETVLSARYPYADGRYWDGNDDQAAAMAALAALDVAHLAARDVRTLSGGERQRVAIAALLAQDAPLLLLDEPASALDLAHQAGVMRLLDQLRGAGRTIVMVGHDLNLAHDIATHALLLMPGGAWIAGPIDGVLTSSNLQECLGHPVERITHGERTYFLPARALP